jgi:SAM-dependent methyltransferase
VDASRVVNGTSSHVAELTKLSGSPPGTGPARRAGRVLRSSTSLLELLLFLRALPFVGTKYRCCCCGWRLRAFSAGGWSLRTRVAGYCPRCSSKARHRRIWHFLTERKGLLATPMSLLEVSPHYSFSRRWVRMKHLRFVGTDLVERPHIAVGMDLTAAPLRSATFDAILCVHVLEEIPDDRAAMEELFRLVKPGGWVLVGVPTRLDRDTYEDPSITTRKERRRAFGEEAHVRIYGRDLIERLRRSGFDVHVDLAGDLPDEVVVKFGLRKEENLFLCRRPGP